MAINSQKLIELAARDIPQVAIAKALGISESRVSQLLTREDVQEKVSELEAEYALVEIDAIVSLERINGNLLKRMDSLTEESDSLSEVVNAYEKLVKLQAIKKGGNIDSEAGIKKITMNAPIFLQQNINISTSSKNEIIDINKRPMTTMPTRQVFNLIKDHAEAKDTSEDTDPSTVEF